jgi:transposase
MFQLTNYNVRRRYLEEKYRAQIMEGTPFTYKAMAAMFETDERTIYTWITKVEKLQHLPANSAKQTKLSAWINDGTLKVGKK